LSFLSIDNEKRHYPTSKANNLFSLKRDFIRSSGCIKENLTIKNEESFLVAEGGLFYDPLEFTAQGKSPASASVKSGNQT
jgi:hypothetical protein